jgi:hypothetical protein
LLAAGIILAYSSGPPNGVTGRPGEGTCPACHSGSSGSPDSSNLLGFGPTGYEPDSQYTLTLTVSHAGQRRWGFQLTAVDSTGRPVGQLIALDPVNTQYDTSQVGGYQYVKQTSAGTFPGQVGQANWTIGWRAPNVAAGAVTFYWCANAANNNNSASGDTIIRDSLVVAEAAGVSSQPKHGRFAWHYSNPSRNTVVIRYRGSAETPVRIYSAGGRLVRRLWPESGGEILSVRWDGRDHSGALVPEATYFVRLGAEVTSVASVRLVR